MQLIFFTGNKLRFSLLCDQPICPTGAPHLPSHVLSATIGNLGIILLNQSTTY
ncbi:hypothetical protein YPC_2149 [Yersinia pestis biovar Medievalis str. Harbin 35]|nr:hypothetical protein YPC_2149 [Yersinia pestis biovar Medievalis str. Harbin 35]